MNTISDADAVGVDVDTGDVVDIVAAVELVAVDDIVVVDDDDDYIGAVVDGDVVDVDVEVRISVAALMAKIAVLVVGVVAELRIWYYYRYDNEYQSLLHHT
ncbi:hypothetical protein FRACYDRAFT_251504 [Fragilariopsis cylindrus CCMP1102]|uniref:Uncharacterized protein n=1 Tax=Fragilariopsis cylindrus CCMP1102 TaxID=635003 RepID=A0A1E7ENT9_9STRA|nr:hypothetical protein FRACYDRAFT_251504 [Fragilariopsis cylindrus CCMP1102]|eukprot:OEU07193.1 hypothetical protein FRACYDRAFT_251504 [Fragilariopsis cylindrus CCMP1102]